MLSEEGQRIRLWLLQNVKNAPPSATIQEARAGLEAMASRKPLPVGTKVEAIMAGNVPCEWVSAPEAPMNSVILYLRGGAYTMGSNITARILAPLLAAASGCRVLAANYRSAPEYPFPAALDDATTTYRWLLNQGVLPRHIVIAGDSSGGGLTLATLTTLRDAAVDLPACAVLLSPWTDLACTGESMITRAEADLFTKADKIRYHAALYAYKTDLRHPLISPLYADLHGLPPLLIHVGTDDMIMDDSTRVAERAKAAGVDVTLDIWEGMWHVWHAFAPQLPEGQRALEQIGQFIRRKLA